MCRMQIVIVLLECKVEGDWTDNKGFQARSKDREILEEGGGAGPSTLPRRDHE